MRGKIEPFNSRAGVKRNFWPDIGFQLFCFSEQINNIWQLLFWCVLHKIKQFGWRCQVPTTSYSTGKTLTIEKFRSLLLTSIFFSHPNPNPNPTHLPKLEFLSLHNEIYQRIFYVEYQSVHSYMVWSQKFRKSEILLDTGHCGGR